VICYFDTSALLKLLVDEPDAQHVRGVYRDARSVCTHGIAYVEILAGLGKAERMGRIPDQLMPRLLEQVDRLWAQIDVVQLDEMMSRRAGQLALRHDLRAFDAVHLAAAERAFGVVGRRSRYRLVATDKRMRAGARALGIEVAPD
jgi:hypothetical protein